MKSMFGEEAKAIGGEPGAALQRNDPLFSYKKLDVPDFICTVVCAGLNINTVLSGEESVEETSSKLGDPNSAAPLNIKVTADDTEGQHTLLNSITGNHKGANGLYECETTLP